MSVKCGNCKQEHDTAYDVRMCYKVRRAETEGQQPLPLTASDQAYGKGSTTNATLSDKQLTFLSRLLDERPAWRDGQGCTPERVTALTRSEASNLIDHITKDVPKEVMPEPRPDVPEGRYALPNVGAQDDALVFYQVDKPKTGRWAGYLFLSMLLGSPGDFEKNRVPRAQEPSILDRIAVEPVEAALRFSRKFTVCAKCLSPLTQVRSRATGFGPVCSMKLGVRYIPRDEALRRLDELGLSKEGLEDLEDDEPSTEGCTHKPSRKDKKAGYPACMFCIETGDCDGKKGTCRTHSATWDVWEDRMADAENSKF